MLPRRKITSCYFPKLNLSTIYSSCANFRPKGNGVNDVNNRTIYACIPKVKHLKKLFTIQRHLWFLYCLLQPSFVHFNCLLQRHLGIFIVYYNAICAFSLFTTMQFVHFDCLLQRHLCIFIVYYNAICAFWFFTTTQFVHFHCLLQRNLCTSIKPFFIIPCTCRQLNNPSQYRAPAGNWTIHHNTVHLQATEQSIIIPCTCRQLNNPS